MHHKVGLTEHVTALVLTTALFRDVRLEAHVGQGQVLNRESCAVKTPNYTEALPEMDILSECSELRAERGQLEGFRLDEIAILVKSCTLVSVITQKPMRKHTYICIR